jgi:uncharacterized membrane protein YphA (DoxX/SURF4 family)
MATEQTVGTAQSAAQQTKSFTRFIPCIARILMGLGFFIFGLNGFLNFLPQPKEAMPEGAAALFGGFMKSGYMMPLISGTQLVVGILLLLNLFVPLALVLIMPVLVNIIAFHLFLQPKGIAPGIIMTLLELYLAWTYRSYYREVLSMRARPNA